MQSQATPRADLLRCAHVGVALGAPVRVRREIGERFAVEADVQPRDGFGKVVVDAAQICEDCAEIVPRSAPRSR